MRSSHARVTSDQPMVTK